MFGCARTSGLPMLVREDFVVYQSSCHDQARAQHKVYANRMKRQYDQQIKAKECPIHIGDQVLFKRDVIRKKISPWDPDPFTVDLIKGSMITASRSNPRPQCAARSSSCLKLHRGPDAIEKLENIVDSKPNEPRVVEEGVQLSNEQPEVEVGEPQLEVQRSKDENQSPNRRNKVGRPT